MAQTHQNISDCAEKGSGQWFLESEAFLNWRTGKDNPLWCWGIPGAGKTVIASIIVNHLRRARAEDQRRKLGIAVVYLKYNEPDQTLDNVLGSILRQLVQDSDSVPPAMLDLHEHHRGRNTSPNLDEIAKLFNSTLDTYEEVFLVVDGLDECNEQLRWDLIEQFEPLSPGLRLFVTSRYLDAIDEELSGFHRYEIKANRADIELFIDYQIKKNRNLRKIVQKAPKLRTDIKNGVINTAEGMFLLARLHVESLASAAGLSIKHVRQKLRELPTTLTESYDNAMQRITDQEPDHKRVAYKTLAWVAYAFRSLSLRELQHALAIEPGDNELDEELMMDGQSITALCAGLVMVDQGTNIINLVHYSTKNYFEDTRHNFFPSFHASITLSCATYLTLGALQNIPISQIIQKYPLACYAAQYLGDHARNTPEEALEPSILEAICQLLVHPDKRKPLLSLLDGLDLIQSGFYSTKIGSDTAAEEDTQNLVTTLVDTFESQQPTEFNEIEIESVSLTIADLSIDGSFPSEDAESNSAIQGNNLWEAKMRASRIPEVTALHLAASMGLAKVASMLLKETPNIDAVDETGKTALAVAMERGFEKAVEFLINSGASVDLHHEHGRGVLLLVAERNWRNVGDIIVAKARSKLEEGEPATEECQIRFISATYDGDIAEVRRLADQPTFNLHDRERSTGETALFIAVEHENSLMVEVLLTSGVDVNAKDSRGQTALFRATRRQDEAMIKLLLSRSIKVDNRDDEGRTAWSANVRSRNRNILGILLAAGADPSTRGLQGVSELYSAAKDGETDLVRFMLESGTNPSVQTEYDWAPLHWAASYGHVECVDLLIGAGANVSVRSDQGVTPLDLAIKSDQLIIIDILKRAGAKESKDSEIQSSVTALGEPIDSESSWVTVDQALVSPAKLEDTSFDSKLFLVFDKPLYRTLLKGTNFGQFVYPRKQIDSPTPGGYIYQISHVMESPATAISIRHAVRRAEMYEYPLNQDHFNSDDVLYDLHRMRSDYQEFEIRPRHQNPFPYPLLMHKDWTGSWKIRRMDEDSDLQFRTTPDWSTATDQDCRWVTNNGTLLARSGWDDETPNICFELTPQRQMVDLILSCWVAKLWAETAVLIRRET